MSTFGWIILALVGLIYLSVLAVYVVILLLIGSLNKFFDSTN